MLPRTIALSCLMLLTACGKEAPTKPEASPTKAAEAPGKLPTKRLPPNDPHAAPSPSEDAETPLLMSAPGTFDVTVEGRLSHYRRIPVGQNRAVALPDDNVARVSVAGALNDEGFPNIRITLEDFRPDQATYPATLSSKATEGPRVSVRYQFTEKRLYKTDHDKGAEVEVKVDGYEGKTIRGSFKGKVAPTAAGLGDPIAVSGEFSVELALRNVEPGPAPAGGEGAGAASPPGEGSATPEGSKPPAGAAQPGEPL